MKKAILSLTLCAALALCGAVSSLAATSGSTAAALSASAAENAGVTAGTLQFVDTKGQPVPYLYIFWDKHPNFGDYTLPVGFPTGPDGIWEPPYALEDENGRPLSSKTFTVKNLFGGVYQFEKTYEINLPQNQTAPIRLVWDKELPMKSLESQTHRLTIHIQDEAGKPIPGAKVQLIKPDFSDQRDFRFPGVTDAKGNYYTNLHDDITYTVLIKCPDPKYGSIDREYQIDAGKGGGISKTFVIKDRTKSYIRYF